MECPICYCEMDEKRILKTPCGHRFHRECMTKWACTDEHKNDCVVPCPLCRTELDMVSLLFGASLFIDVTDALFGDEPFYLAFNATS
jgi:hypothetical protein